MQAYSLLFIKNKNQIPFSGKHQSSCLAPDAFADFVFHKFLYLLSLI
jgi:hypothetical protein